MQSKNKGYWEVIYKTTPKEMLPWDAVKIDKLLVEIITEKKIKNGLILDLGCGPGTSTRFFAENKYDVVGIDFSQAAIKQAKKECSKTKKAKFILGDMISLPFKKNSFVFIFDRGSFHHLDLKDVEKSVDGFREVLKKNGNFYLQAFSSKSIISDLSFSREDIEDYFTGFEIIEFEEIKRFGPKGEKIILNSVFMEKK